MEWRRQKSEQRRQIKEKELFGGLRAVHQC
jgi:hypothetical protein